MFFWLTSLLDSVFRAADDIQRRRSQEKAARIEAARKKLRDELKASPP